MEISSMIGHTLQGYMIVLELSSSREDEDTTVRFFSGMDEREVSYLYEVFRLLNTDQQGLIDFLRDNEAPDSMWQHGVRRSAGEPEHEFYLHRLGLHIDNDVAYGIQEIVFFEDDVVDLADQFRGKWADYLY